MRQKAEDEMGKKRKNAGRKTATAENERTGTDAADATDNNAGSCPLFIDPEPAEEPVNGTVMLAEVQGVIRRHVVMSDREILAVSLWIIHSYCPDLGRVSPYLALESPAMRCGKTSALSTVGALTPRGMAMANVTGPALFRLMHQHSPTMLIDEVDMVIHTNRDIQVILNAAHRQQTAFIPRIVSGETVAFRVFGPKALACIGRLPATLQDRSIVVNLQRKRPSEIVDPLPLDPSNAYLPISRRIARWVRDARELISQQVTGIPPGINDRAADNWRPLLAIADVIGPQCGAQARECAVALSRAADTESVDPAEQLIRDIASFFATHRVRQVPVETLHRALINMDGGMWSEYSNGQPLSRARLGRILSPFGIHSEPARVRGRIVRVYRRDAFLDAFSRYCPSVLCDGPVAA